MIDPDVMEAIKLVDQSLRAVAGHLDVMITSVEPAAAGEAEPTAVSSIDPPAAAYESDAAPPPTAVEQVWGS